MYRDNTKTGRAGRNPRCSGIYCPKHESCVRVRLWLTGANQGPQPSRHQGVESGGGCVYASEKEGTLMLCRLQRRLSSPRQKRGSGKTMLFGEPVNLSQEILRNRDVDSLCPAFECGKVDINHDPDSTGIIRICGKSLNARCGGNIVALVKMAFDRFLYVFDCIFHRVPGSEAPGEVWNRDTVTALLVLVDDNGKQHDLPPVPTGLPVNAAKRAHREILRRMLDRHLAWFGSMPELMMTAFDGDHEPAILLESVYDFRTAHVCKDTHHTTLSQQKIRGEP